MSLRIAMSKAAGYIAVILSFGVLALTIVGLNARHWHWSSAMSALYYISACVALLVACVGFIAARSSRYLAITVGVLLINGLLFLVFTKNAAEF
jgi:hypothetical protein